MAFYFRSFSLRTLGIFTGAATFFYLFKKLRKAKCDKKEDDADNQAQQKVGFVTKYVKVPQGCIGLLIGRHGRQARQLEFETKTFTSIVYFNENEIRKLRNSDPMTQWDMRSQEEEEDWSREGKKLEKKKDQFAFFKIQGKTKDSVELAICKVKSIITDWHRNNIITNFNVPQEAVGFVLGKNGHNLKMICHACQVRARILCTDGNYEVMEIKGTEEGVTAAIGRFEASIARYYRNANEGEVTEFAPEPKYQRGIYADIQEELKDLAKLRKELETEEEFW